MVADPGGVNLDPDPTLEKTPDPNSTLGNDLIELTFNVFLPIYCVSKN